MEIELIQFYSCISQSSYQIICHLNSDPKSVFEALPESGQNGFEMFDSFEHTKFCLPGMAMDSVLHLILIISFSLTA